jgi:hypothetical protein
LTPAVRVMTLRAVHRVSRTVPDGHDPWSWAVDEIVGGSVSHDGISRVQHGLWQAYVVHYEVGNGGLRQVHVNLEPAFIESTGAFLREIGAPRHAELLVESARLFAQDPGDGAFDPLDHEWYDEKPLEPIVEAYIAAHADEFFSD